MGLLNIMINQWDSPPETKDPNLIILEGVTSKEDYRKKARGNLTVAEALAETDQKSALQDVKERALEYLEYSGHKRLPRSLKFHYRGCVDCDSPRWHGSYYHDIGITGPPELIEEIRIGQDIDNEDFD